MKGLERRGFRIRWAILILLLFPIAAGFAASLLLPGILERRITTELLKMGFRGVHLRVRSLGLGHIDLSEISLGAAPPRGATLASATVDFSLPELLKNRFERISLSGLEATLRIDRNGFTAPGLEPLLKPSTGEMPSFKRLVLKGGTITLLLPDRSLRIPLEADLATPDREGPTKIEVRLYPRGEEVRLSGALDLRRGDGAVTATLERASALSFLSDLSLQALHLLRLDASWESRTEFRSWKATSTRVALKAPAFRLAWEKSTLSGAGALSFRIDGRGGVKEVELRLSLRQESAQALQTVLPMDIHVTGPDSERLLFSLSPLAFRSPGGVRVETLRGELLRKGEEIDVTGSFTGGADLSSLAAPLSLDSAQGRVALEGRFSLSLGREGLRWTLTGSASGSSLSLKREEMELQLGLLRLPFHAQGGRDSSTARGTLLLSRSSLRKGSGLTVENLEAQIPWRYPLPSSGQTQNERGTLRLSGVETPPFHWGDLRGELSLERDSLRFFGTLRAPLAPLRVKMEGTLRQERGRPLFSLHYTLPLTKLHHSDSLESLSPLLKGYSFAGDLSGSGSLSFSGKALASPSAFRLANGEFRTTSGTPLSVSGVEGELKMEETLALRSRKGLRFLFREAKAGGILVPGGDLSFTVEGPESLLVEGANLNYSRGRISLHPFRYTFGTSGFTCTLYCDRIRFDDTINQLMGEPAAQGDAELNGLVTLTVKEGLPIFQTGHLYSTPGVGGNLRLKRGSLASGGMVLVEEAMSDFNYDWVRVTLESAGEKLNLTAFINGAPARKLPLAYDPGKREFVREPSGKRSVDLKGLLLELRFREIDLKSLLSGGSRVEWR